MVKTLCFCLLSMLVLLTMIPKVYAEDSWVLFHRGRGADANLYYNKETIKKIDENIIEVYDASIHAEGEKSVRQTRIDCMNKKWAVGASDVYIRDRKIQSFDFSRAGWVWFPPRNAAENKLITIICKKQRK